MSKVRSSLPVLGMWLRCDLRRRGRSLVVLALLVAVGSGTVCTAFAGARRGASAITRLQDRTLPATTAVLANTPGFDWRRVERLPEVAGLTRFVVDYSIGADDVPAEALAFPPADDHVLRTVERPVILRGRRFDPTKVDEVVVTRQFVRTTGRDLGDSVTIRLPRPADLKSDEAPLRGPKVRARIVGVIVSPWYVDLAGQPGALLVSPALTERYAASVIGDPKDPENTQFVNALVRLRHGEADLERFRQDLARVTGRDDIDSWNLPEQAREVQRTVAFEAWCLAAFGLAALAAALFLVGQAIARFVAAGIEELRAVTALGMTPTEAAVAASVGPVLAGVGGGLLGLVGAYVASARFPIGGARLIEPAPGRSLDLVVLVPGLVLTLAVVAVGSVVAARRSLGSTRRRAARSVITDLVGRRPVPVPLAIGARFALETGRGRRAVPVRPALVGAVVGLLGISAAFTFSRAVDDAASNPERFGQTYDQVAFVGINNTDFGPAGKMVQALAKDRGVTGVDRARTAVVSSPGGSASISLFTNDRGRKRLPVVLTAGRMVRAPDEVVLAPRTLDALGRGVGDRVRLAGSRRTATYRIVGAGFVPTGPHNGYAEGGWTTSAGYERIVDGFKFDVVLIRTTTPDEPEATSARLSKLLSRSDPALRGAEVAPPDPLDAVATIKHVQVLPIALGIFLVILALGAVGHALVTAVRRRSGDLAVLRVFGMTPWQCRWIVITQSTLLGLVGLVVGIPLGVVAGRVTWRAVAAYTPLQYVAPLAGAALLLTIPAALLVANLLGAWPGQRAARLRVSRVLRAE